MYVTVTLTESDNLFSDLDVTLISFAKLYVQITSWSDDRQCVTKFDREYPGLIHYSNTVLFIPFNHSWTIQQSISNKRLGIGRTKTPLLLVLTHFRGVKFPMIGLVHSATFNTEFKKENRYTYHYSPTQ
jgi:hypothetical protein